MKKPFVVCHIFCALDGKIDGPFMAVPEAAPALKEYGRLREDYGCDAVLYGTTTMAGGFSDGLAPELPPAEKNWPAEDYVSDSDVKNCVAAVDPKGILGWNSKYMEKKGRPKAQVIEVLTEQVSPAYLDYLRKRDISYIFAGKEMLDCALALEKLSGLFGVERLMIAGGGTVNWSFQQEGLIDELSLVVAPVADGSRQAVSVFEKADFLPDRGAAAFTLAEVKRLEGDGLWLRYRKKERA